VRFLTARRLILAGIVLLLLGGAIAFFYPRIAEAYHLRLAQRALEGYDFPTAKTHLERCIALRPGDAEAHFLLARTCRRAGDRAGAAASLQEARRLNFDPKKIGLEELLAQAQAGLVVPLEQNLRWALASHPEEERVILEALIVGSLQANFSREAFNWANRWAEHFPDDPQALFWRARALELGLRPEPAIREYRQLLERKPDHAEAHLRLGQVYLREGRFPDARPEFEACLQLRPDDTEALYGLARCQRELGQTEAVRETLDRLLTLDKDHAGGLLLRGQLELAAEHPEAALPWLRRARTARPRDREANQALANALRALRQEEEARGYERVREEIDRDLKQLKEVVRRAIDAPRDATLRYEAGTLLQRLGQDEQAAHWLFSALQLDPAHEPTRQALTQCLQKLGDPRLTDLQNQVTKP
jgi:tetratricopeptide (TPR) repeat protein